MSKLQTLVKQVEACRLCPLCRGRHRAVPGEGNENATVLLIGEGPGYHEDREGRPFIGPAGQFLDELLELAGLRRADVYITNVVKCRPPNNRDPLPLEIESCAPYLERQIAAIDPKVIVTLGRYSMAKFVKETSISRIHGQAWQQDGRLVVTMYHPAAGLHNQQLKDVIREDFRKLPGFIEQARYIEATPPTAPAAAEDPRAVLDAYALLVAAAESPTEPVVAASPLSAIEALLVAPVAPSEAPLAVNPAPEAASSPVELVPDLAALPVVAEAPPTPARRERRRKVLAEQPPEPFVATPALESEPAPPELLVVASEEPPAIPVAATLVVEAVPTHEETPSLVEATLALETVPDLADMAAALDATPAATNGHLDALAETTAPTLPAPTPEPLPDSLSAPPGRKKGKAAVEAEQLSMF